MRDDNPNGAPEDTIGDPAGPEQKPGIVVDTEGNTIGSLYGTPEEREEWQARQRAGEWGELMMGVTPVDEWDEKVEEYIKGAGLSDAVAQDLRKWIFGEQGRATITQQAEEWLDKIAGAEPTQDDRQRLIEMCEGDSELIRKVKILLDVLDKTWVWWGPNGCHRWADEFERQYKKLDAQDRFAYQHVYPLCDVWYMPLWGEHSVIMFTLNGNTVYLDKWLQGRSDHIAFEPRNDLIYPGDPRYERRMREMLERMRAAQKAAWSTEFVGEIWLGQVAKCVV